MSEKRREKLSRLCLPVFTAALPKGQLGILFVSVSLVGSLHSVACFYGLQDLRGFLVFRYSPGCFLDLLSVVLPRYVASGSADRSNFSSLTVGRNTSMNAIESK